MPSPISLAKAWELTYRFLASFDSLRYEECRVARLLACPVHDYLGLGHTHDFSARRWLDAWPGRLFLRLRSYRRRALLKDWGEAGAVFATTASRGVLDDALEAVTAPWRSLSVLDHRVPGQPRLAELVPGFRHGWSVSPARKLYADVRRSDPELREWLPADSEWFEVLVRVALDSLDAARVFWEVSGCPGGVTLSWSWMQDMAIGWMGQRLGRKVVPLQHGLVYQANVWEPEAFGAFLAWDEATAREVEELSGGRMPAAAVGPYGLPVIPDKGPALELPNPELPVVLLATAPLPEAWRDHYRALYRALAAEGVPWNLVWKPHPRESPPFDSLGPAALLCSDRSVYDLVAGADAVVGAHTGVIGQAHLLGYRAASFAHPSEGAMIRWFERQGVPLLPGDGDLVAGVQELLASSRPAAQWAPDDGRRASLRLTENLDALFSGRQLPALQDRGSA